MMYCNLSLVNFICWSLHQDYLNSAEHPWSLHRLHDQQQLAKFVEIQELSLEATLLETHWIQTAQSKIVRLVGFQR